MHSTTVVSLLALVLADKAWSHRHAPAPETTGKSEAIPVTTSGPWDDLGPVTFRTERPETAMLDIDTLEASTTTLTGMESTTMTMTTTAAVQVESVIIYDSTSTTTMTLTSSDEPSSDEPSSATSTDTPISTSSTTITTSDVSSSTTTTSAPTGDVLTTVENLTPGPNTVQFPMSSAAPVVVINVPSDSYSSGYTTETIWSSVWEPRNIAVNTVTRPAAFYVPASSSSQTPAPTDKSSGASTARSGAGVIVMTGVGALAACFMML
ncbi:hypothetical protein NEUTE1DRAFT_119391 [Neurospora tetrasperma FGSC 2508]|uniref:Uncharacterized protein n=1 Tax=Neurospora tetrasperma (strain FGSC 2508 / ATCC MYA-4615 / P0657) TaxID=510951 RepID=F8MAU8_NEUT8|nr:uncharacterized protein NEUTE1DRAFT_119391 [Neurospora tetrasperma FGSC 2508]EGO60166.1 hypothetical protein NEUTE1DRAFT_119391 [Neurospora tetrasperma FGSC 2508]EGZ75877.1 hypothetical protein NEUTE2DRAFT_106220 [Neurospora tetrasperma FGSC 2509]